LLELFDSIILLVHMELGEEVKKKPQRQCVEKWRKRKMVVRLRFEETGNKQDHFFILTSVLKEYED